MSRITHSGSVLLIGSQGLLGNEIAFEFKKTFPDVALIESTSQDLNITDENSVGTAIQKVRPQWIINAAAYTDVDKAEVERDTAKALNAIGPTNLARQANLFGARLIHFSTDYVFSGEGERPWKENDVTLPVQPNWYGETKLLGEKAVLNYPEHLVLRIQWLYGKKRNRFAILRERETFSPFVDQFGAPTWTKDVVRALFPLMAQSASGLFHFAYDDFASWMDVFQFVKEELKLPIHFIPKKSRDVNLPARRPLNGRLSNEKLKKQLGLESLGSWKSSLKEFLKQVQDD